MPKTKMLCHAALFAIGAVTAAQAPVVAQQAPTTNSAAPVINAAAAAEPIAGWSQIAAENPRFVIFGEYHGTEQSPALFGDVAAALAQRGKRVLVAVELDSYVNPAVQTAWAGPHDAFAAALTAKGWAKRNDGIGSVAMLDMLVRLHALKADGAPISVVAFNGARDEAQREKLKAQASTAGHEMAQAENIREAADAAPYDMVLILVGNVHASKQDVSFRDETYQPMAMHLAKAGKIVSLNMAAGEGSAWNCRLDPEVRREPGQPVTSEMIKCGAWPYGSKTALEKPPHVALGPLPGREADARYDGYFWVGSVSASPPAVP